MDKGHWPRCLLWHGWLPQLSGVNGGSPWAASAADSAGYLVESALGGYSSGLCAEWGLPDGFDADEVAARMLDSPEIWSDGSLVLDSVTGISAAGAGLLLTSLITAGVARRWGHVDRVQSDRVHFLVEVLCQYLDLCRLHRGLTCGRVILLFSLLMPFMWGLTILVLFGMLGLLDGCYCSLPFELVTDGDLLVLTRRMLDL